MTDQFPVLSAQKSIALPGSDLFETVRRKLIDDLGQLANLRLHSLR